ncbi:MAG: EAL domain-containing protein [Rhodocyclaceae bacterium]|nr:EAL domain-containing protein [Rhodocyclaceae bacterium]
MPLAELVHYLNRQNRDSYGAGICPGDGLSIGPAGVLGHDGDLLLRSVFQPVSAARGGRVIGHEALLRAESDDGESLTAADVFRRPASPEKLIYLDRLCRTLHALNYLQLTRAGGGTLFLNVEPRHVRAVTSGHGLVFEAILKRCGLSPENIFFELRAGELTGDPATLADALAAYRARGYRIAIDQAGPDLDRTLLATLRPELVKFDVRTLERWRGAGSAENAAADAARACREIGAEIAATHVAAVRHLAPARAFAADYLQGHYLAPPSPDLGRGELPSLPLAEDDAALAPIRG